MIDKKSRRVVIINNIQSDTIDQAIFILKSEKNGVDKVFNERSIAAEAQDIINNYIRQVERLKGLHCSDSSKKHKSPFFAHLFTMVLTAAFMLIIFFVAAYNL